jgi:hypothetical protein
LVQDIQIATEADPNEGGAWKLAVNEAQPKVICFLPAETLMKPYTACVGTLLLKLPGAQLLDIDLLIKPASKASS